MRQKFFLTMILFLTISFQFSFANQIEIPSGVFYYQPASSVFGSEAAWVNPAGLSLYNASGYQLMADYYDGNYAKSWGMVMHREGIGVAYRKIRNPDTTDFKEYIVSGGMNIGGDLNVGLSYQHFKDGPGIYHDRHLWNIGFVGTSGPKYRWGVLFSNLNRSKIDGENSETEMRYSLAYRPYGKKLTIAADMFLSTGTRFRNADFIYHLNLTPIKGLFLNGYIDNNSNFEIGFRVNLLKSFTGARRSSNKKGHHRGSTFFYGSSDKSQESIIKQPKRRLNVLISGRPQENPVQPKFGKKQQSYLVTLLDIYRAADDESIKEIVLKLDRLALGFSQAQELREAVKYFKSKNKKVTAYLHYPNNISYYVSSICDKIIIPPVSQLNLVGLKAELTFYASAFDKLGVNIDILRIGDYKTAAESYTREASTKENKEQINRLLDDIYEQFVEGIAEGKKLSADSVKKIIDNGPYTSVEALNAGLVDTLLYFDEIKRGIIKEYFLQPQISMADYHNDTLINESWKKIPTLAIVVAQGEVQSNNHIRTFFSSTTDLTPQKMEFAMAQAVGDWNVKSIIVRINSPGGDALAGEEIYHAFEKISSRLEPIYISMSNVAASGGYYIGMAGENIFANPATITGSIGIYGGKADFSNLYEKISLGKELYTRGKNAGMLSTLKPFTKLEREKYFSHLKAMYNRFVMLVADNRNLPADSIDNLSRGKVWTGLEAKQHGLVDHIGGIKETLDFAASRLGLKEYKVEIYPKKRPLFVFPGTSLFSPLAALLSSDDEADIAESILPLGSAEFYTRLPFDILIE